MCLIIIALAIFFVLKETTEFIIRASTKYFVWTKLIIMSITNLSKFYYEIYIQCVLKIVWKLNLYDTGSGKHTLVLNWQWKICKDKQLFWELYLKSSSTMGLQLWLLPWVWLVNPTFLSTAVYKQFGDVERSLGARF